MGDNVEFITCYGALHTMGGLAIAEDIDSLIKGINSSADTLEEGGEVAEE